MDGPLSRTVDGLMQEVILPIRSMYGIFINIYPQNHPNTSLYTMFLNVNPMPETYHVGMVLHILYIVYI